MNRRNMSSAKRCLNHMPSRLTPIVRETLWLGTDDDGLSIVLECCMEFILVLLYMSYVGCVESFPCSM